MNIEKCGLIDALPRKKQLEIEYRLDILAKPIPGEQYMSKGLV